MKKRVFNSILAFLMIGTIITSFACCGEDNSSAQNNTSESLSEVENTDGESALSLWSDKSEFKTKMIDYMKSITDESGDDFIPVEDRIAVFDFDGTLFCETDPVYLDHRLLAYRVQEDKDYKDNASAFEREVAKKVDEFAETGVYPEGMDIDHGKAVASAFTGMTVEGFVEYVKDYGNKPAPGYKGMKNIDAYYQPMVQVVNYLIANEFKVYIVSGTDRLILRGLVDGKLDIPNSQIIGSDETIVASNQKDVDGLEYTYTDDDELILGGEFVTKNLKMNKVSVIAQEIGKQPVLAFGNSSGDESMGKYTTDDNKYKSMAVMLCCDDTKRENGNVEKAKKMKETCKNYGWIAVSMKNDWTTIYGDGVKKK